MKLLRTFALLALASCGSPTPIVPEEPREQPVAAPLSRCDEIASRFLATVNGAPGTCATSADCACYNPVEASLGCGGVTDAATAARLGAIESEFHAASCPWPHQCGAWECAPRCESGRCVH